jgi:Fe-S cluster biogenesis protein NfuA
MSVAESLVKQFDRMVKRDGGSVSLLDVQGTRITVAYRPGAAPDCGTGVCIMPHIELQAMMSETLARRDPTLSILVLEDRTPP